MVSPVESTPSPLVSASAPFFSTEIDGVGSRLRYRQAMFCSCPLPAADRGSVTSVVVPVPDATVVPRPLTQTYVLV